jgi:hypothetical protein
MASLIASAEELGEYDMARAASPETTGALAEVPQNSPYCPPRIVVRSQPGAATETQGP